jgi:Na+-driven multidrug efflux pump
VGIGVLAAVLIALVGPLAARLLGASGDVLDVSTEYLTVRAWGMPAVLWALAAVGILRGVRDMVSPLRIIAVVAVLTLAPVAPLAFSADPAVRSAASAALAVLALMLVPGAFAFAYDGILIGAGRYRELGGAIAVSLVMFAVAVTMVAAWWPQTLRLGLAGVWGALALWMLARAWIIGRIWARVAS